MKRFLLLLVLELFIKGTWNVCFDNVPLKELPPLHLYQTFMKSNPQTALVVGHMGNILEYQENTLEGMKSAISLQAHGVHMKVQLTKDNKLILFGDDNLYRMTGEDYEVYKLPYKEIQKMNIQRNIIYSKGFTKSITRKYSSTLKIPLLREVLNEVRGSNMLLYLELIPGNVPPLSPADRHRSEITAKYIAELIKDLNLGNEVIIVSKDAFKLAAINAYDSSLVTGWWFDETYFQDRTADRIKYEYNDLPQIYQQKCFLNNKETGFAFSKYLLTSGIISKTVNASIADFSYAILKDEKYFKTSTQSIGSIVKRSYGHSATLGAFKIFALDAKEASRKEDISFADSALSIGVTRFITDDVNRLKLALKESVVKPSTGSSLKSYCAWFILTLLFVKAVMTILFI